MVPQNKGQKQRFTDGAIYCHLFNLDKTELPQQIIQARTPHVLGECFAESGIEPQTRIISP